MTSFSEVNQFSDSNSVPVNNQNHRVQNEEEKDVRPPINIRNQKDFNKEVNNSENLQRSRKNSEMCGIHRKETVDEKGPQTMNASINLRNDFYPQTDLRTTCIENTQNPKMYSDELEGNFNSSQDCDQGSNLSNKSSIKSEMTDQTLTEESPKANDIKVSSKPIPEQITSLQNQDHEVNRKTKPIVNRENISQVSEGTELFKSSSENALETKYFLPDIINTTTVETIKNPDTSISHSNCANSDKGRSPQPKSFLTQTSYLPSVLHSDTLQNEMELELKQLKSLSSLQTYQNIYKLAYDENLTDQSENDSRSPSPVEPESQVPASLTSAEILIHEADSGSDAGSEDVELLPHRYESETSLSENKHVYVNKLSLAVELLRTQESLPYDDEFKRVVGENIVPGVHTGGKINQGFVGDSCPPTASSMSNFFETDSASLDKNQKEVVLPCQLKRSAHSSSDSAIFSDIGSDNLDDELCEAAKEAINQSSEIQNCTEEVRAGYRRFGAQPRQFFSPRAALSLNPCFCCIVM